VTYGAAHAQSVTGTPERTGLFAHLRRRSPRRGLRARQPQPAGVSQDNAISL